MFDDYDMNAKDICDRDCASLKDGGYCEFYLKELEAVDICGSISDGPYFMCDECIEDTYYGG